MNHTPPLPLRGPRPKRTLGRKRRRTKVDAFNFHTRYLAVLAHLDIKTKEVEHLQERLQSLTSVRTSEAIALENIEPVEDFTYAPCTPNRHSGCGTRTLSCGSFEGQCDPTVHGDPDDLGDGTGQESVVKEVPVPELRAVQPEDWDHVQSFTPVISKGRVTRTPMSMNNTPAMSADSDLFDGSNSDTERDRIIDTVFGDRSSVRRRLQQKTPSREGSSSKEDGDTGV
jgi:predicted metalloenzyme YecM